MSSSRSVVIDLAVRVLWTPTSSFRELFIKQRRVCYERVSSVIFYRTKECMNLTPNAPPRRQRKIKGTCTNEDKEGDLRIYRPWGPSRGSSSPFTFEPAWVRPDWVSIQLASMPESWQQGPLPHRTRRFFPCGGWNHRQCSLQLPATLGAVARLSGLENTGMVVTNTGIIRARVA